MRTLKKLFENNQAWVKRMTEADPDFFANLASEQLPEILWIGCADSRVPANEIVGLPPGDLFVHRNVANMVVHTDLNCLSVIQFAVEVLKVKHIIVCGHYGCGGVMAALKREQHGLIDNWLRHIVDVHEKHCDLFADSESENVQANRLCELNVIEQARNLCHTTIMKDAWDRKQDVTVHVWIYDIADGLLKELENCIDSQDEVERFYQEAISRLKP